MSARANPSTARLIKLYDLYRLTEEQIKVVEGKQNVYYPDEQEITQKDCFGFLDYNHRIDFGDGYIAPLDGFSGVVKQTYSLKNIEDGFIYPPLVYQPEEKGKETEGTRRADWKQQVYPSHMVTFDRPETRISLRRGKGAFLIHLIGYLFGVRLQFEGWWFDGRVHLNRSHSITFQEDTVSDFLKWGLRKWHTLALGERRLFTNILFMHDRIPMYQWDWERFAVEYMVFDGLCKLYESMTNKRHKNGKHKGKDDFNSIDFMCTELGIPFDHAITEEIVDLRNQLFHETLWSNGQPCTAVPGSAFYRALNIRRLNQRLIPCLLDYRSNYTKTNWCTLGTWEFDRYNR